MLFRSELIVNDPILITGASGGLGVHLVQFLLTNGVRDLVCQYRTNPGDIAATLSQHGMDPAERLFQADLTREQDVVCLRQKTEAAFGPLYGLVNLVGGSTNSMSWKLSVEEFQRVIDQNLLSTFLACREFVPGMRGRHSGRIVNISSVVAYTGAPGASHYCAAKAAVLGFSKALALELAPKNIAVSVVALGYFQLGLINTIPELQREQIRGRIPVLRFGRGEELGGLVSYLLGPSGAYASGQVYHLNGGLYT